MILVTGGTGFIGQVLIRHLVDMGYQVRTLFRPSKTTPRLPRGVGVEAVVCGFNDERGLRSAMRGVNVVFHLAGAEQSGSRADLQGVDIEGTRSLAKIAAESKIERFIGISHLGADRASAFPVLKAKGIAERLIIQSGVPYTLFRSAIVFGRGDHFSIPLARLLKSNPFLFFLPGEGSSMLQPIWVEDLVTAMVLSVEVEQTCGQVFSVGGPEFITFRQVVGVIARAAGLRRTIIATSPAYLRLLSVWLESTSRRFPLSIFWADYLAADRTCELDTLPRTFGLIPERFSRKIDYLSELN